MNLTAGEDLIATSASNYYDGVTQAEAEAFYGAMKTPGDTMPPSYGLNSRLVKRNGKIYEEVNRIGGHYGAAIERIVYWLEKAATVAENDKQRQVINLLIDYYRHGATSKRLTNTRYSGLPTSTRASTSSTDLSRSTATPSD